MLHALTDAERDRESLATSLRSNAGRWRARAARPRNDADRRNCDELRAMAAAADEFAAEIEQRLLVRLPEHTEPEPAGQ